MDIKKVLKIVVFLAIPLGYAVFIFTGSVFARTVWEFLNNALQGRGGVVVKASYAFIIVSIVVWIVFVRKDRRLGSYLSLALLAAAFIGIYLNTEQPDERIHLGEFGVLAPIAHFAFKKGIGIKGEKLFLSVFLFCAFVGIFDEVVQAFVPARVCDWRDMLLNIMSGSIGLFATKLCFHRGAEKGCAGSSDA